MLETDREQQLLEAMLLLKEESQRLVRRHREIMEQFESVMHELYVLRRRRQKQRGQEDLSPAYIATLRGKNAGGAQW